jgi:hypothetical protein
MRRVDRTSGGTTGRVWGREGSYFASEGWGRLPLADMGAGRRNWPGRVESPLDMGLRFWFILWWWWGGVGGESER